MQRRRFLPFSALLVLGMCPLAAPAATNLTITLTGTLGPLLRGSDPLSANGQTGTIVITASESLKPTKTTPTSATYTLPSGSVLINVAGIAFPSTQPSTMIVELTSTADILKVTAAGPLSAVVTAKAYLAPGSWPKSALQHPTAFSPSPQNLTPAAAANGSGSVIKYVFLNSKTELGITGTASN